MRAALLVCALCDDGFAAAQTAEVAPAPSPAPSPTDSGIRWPSDWLGLAGDPQPPLPGIAIAAPSTSDPVQLPKGWTFRFDAPAACTGCARRLGPPIVNGNTPWRTSGTLAWRSDAGTIGVGVVGQRGARLPLFMTPSMGGLPMPAAASDAVLSDTRIQWQVTLSGERTIWRARGGRTVSLLGDVYLPVGTTGRTPRTGDVPTISQTAFVGGIRVRF